MPDWLLRLFGRKVRGFEIVAPWASRLPQIEVTLPSRGTAKAAAYDFYALQYIQIFPGEKKELITDVKAYMKKNEVLHLYVRSSQGIKHDIQLAHNTGVIDADYHENPMNDGAITIVLRNVGDQIYSVQPGDRIAQGEFAKFLVADNDRKKKLPKRKGGVGSTGK